MTLNVNITFVLPAGSRRLALPTHRCEQILWVIQSLVYHLGGGLDLSLFFLVLRRDRQDDATTGLQWFREQQLAGVVILSGYLWSASNFTIIVDLDYVPLWLKYRSCSLASKQQNLDPPIPRQWCSEIDRKSKTIRKASCCWIACFPVVAAFANNETVNFDHAKVAERTWKEVIPHAFGVSLLLTPTRRYRVKSSKRQSWLDVSASSVVPTIGASLVLMIEMYKRKNFPFGSLKSDWSIMC